MFATQAASSLPPARTSEEQKGAIKYLLIREFGTLNQFNGTIEEKKLRIIQLIPEMIKTAMGTLDLPHDGAIHHLIERLDPELKVLILIDLLRKMNPIAFRDTLSLLNRNQAITPEIVDEISNNVKTLLSNLTPEARNNLLKEYFDERAAQSISKSTYAKLVACTAFTTFLIQRVAQTCINHSERRLSQGLAVLACVGAMTTIAPLCFGLRKTEQGIHRVEEMTKNTGNYLYNKAAQVCEHIKRNRTVYGAIAGGVVVTVGLYYVFKRPPSAKVISLNDIPSVNTPSSAPVVLEASAPVVSTQALPEASAPVVSTPVVLEASAQALPSDTGVVAVELPSSPLPPSSIELPSTTASNSTAEETSSSRPNTAVSSFAKSVKVVANFLSQAIPTPHFFD